MKLHLPKLLLTAVLAACASTVFAKGASGWKGDGDGTFYISTEGPHTIDATGVNYTNWNIWSDSGAANNAPTLATVDSIKFKNNDTADIELGQWDDSRYFDTITIKTISVAGDGSATLNVRSGNKASIINTSGGSLNINNAGTLTLGATTENTINLAGTLVNTGELTIKGTLKVSDLSGFTTAIIGGELSDTVNGYRTGYEAHLIINGSETSTINKDTATFDITGKTADDLLWDGNQLGVKTGNTTTTTTIYEIHDTNAGAVVYDSAVEKWTSATEIQMYAGTKLQLQTALAGSVSDGITVKGADSIIELTEGVEHDHSKVTTEEGQKVSYTLDGAVLDLSSVTTSTNISSIDMKNASTVTLHNWQNHLGSQTEKVLINMSGESVLSFKNGNSGNVWADINVSGKAKIQGSTFGDNTNVRGTIKGDGELTLKNMKDAGNEWTVSSTISDAEGKALSLLVTDSANVILRGDNSYTGGTTITSGTLYASHQNALGKGSVTVNGGNLVIGSVNFSNNNPVVSNDSNFADTIEGKELNITNGKVTATYKNPNSNTSVIKKGTTVNINTGGTLHLRGHDMLGWDTESAPDINLASTDSKQMATLHFEELSYINANGTEGPKSTTLGSKISMKGNAQITGATGTTEGSTGTKFNTFGTTLSVTNKNNVVSVDAIEIRNAWTIDVAAGGELTLASKLEIHQDNEGEGKTVNNITKSNTGKLIITGKSSEWYGAMNVTGGTLQLQDDATLGLATVVMSDGTTLETGTGTIAALTLNAGSKLVADAAVSMDGTLTLGGTITLNGGLLTALQSLEAGKTLDLFTNVDSLVLGEATYAKGTNILDATTAKDLSDWFTLTSPEVVAAISESAPTAGSGYYLGYNAEGTVYVGKVIPEPTTATLSLLALAGLAARRRRK